MDPRELGGDTRQRCSPDLGRTSGSEGKRVDTGTPQMDYAGYAWFRTVLPEFEPPGRTWHLGMLDANVEVYLQRKAARFP